MRTLFVGCAFAASLVLAPSPCHADETSHRKAAEEMLLAMNTDKVMQTMVDEMLDLQTKQNPTLAPYKAVMKKFLTKHLGWDSLKDDMVKLYVESFTEAELKEMTRFYKTPVGRKAIEQLPKLTAKGAQLGVEKVQANLAELQRMIAEEEKKNKP